jgi:tetratricopeptide (TPR) repeat protein
VRRHPEDPNYRWAVAQAQLNRGLALMHLSRYREAEESYHRGREALASLVKQSPSRADYQQHLAQAYLSLGMLHISMQRPRQAEAPLGKALELREALARRHPLYAEYQDDVANSYRALSQLYADLNRLPDAEKASRKALDISRRLADRHPREFAYVLRVGQVQNGLGNLALGLKPGVTDFAANMAGLFSGRPRKDEAITWFGEAIRTLSALLKLEPGNDLVRQGLIDAYWGRGVARGTDLAKADLVTAVEDWDRAIALAKDAAARRDMRQHSALVRRLADTPAYRVIYAARLAREGNHARAEAEVEAALGRSSFLYGADLGEAAQVLARCAAAVQADPALAPAERERRFARYADRAVALAMQDGGAKQDNVLIRAGNCCNLGNYLRDEGQPQAALGFYDRAIPLLEKLLAGQPRQADARRFLRNTRWGRAEAGIALGRGVEAGRDCDRALALDDGAGRRDIEIVRATALSRAGRHAEAVRAARRLAQDKTLTADDLYRLARVCGVASGAKASPPGGADAAASADSWAATAIDLLGRAVRKGYKSSAQIEKETDFAALRSRPDFRKLLAGVNPHQPP